MWVKIKGAAEMAAAVRAAGERIGREYAGRDLLLVGLLDGAVFFLADLARAIPQPVEIALLRARSYGGGTRSSGAVELDGEIEVAGRDVLIVEDIYDSGRTLRRVRDHLAGLRPRSLEIAALLVKDVARVEEVEVRHGLLHIPDAFVVGAGLDLAGRGRNLPDLWAAPSDTPPQAALAELERQFGR